jgi:secondary thiamine-phosphate synthase enzyme
VAQKRHNFYFSRSRQGRERAAAYNPPVISTLVVTAPGQGLVEITDRVRSLVRASGLAEGLCTLFLQHTSASLVIQENADPAARLDLERWLLRQVPEDDPLFTHQVEGPDDMPAHVKAALTATCLSIPLVAGDLALGTWQGIFLWEHRRRPRPRSVVVHLGG